MGQKAVKGDPTADEKALSAINRLSQRAGHVKKGFENGTEVSCSCEWNEV